MKPSNQVVCDYIAGMTDRYAIAKYKELMIHQFGVFIKIRWEECTMFYPEELVEEVRTRNDIVDVIGFLCKITEKRQ